MQLSLKATALAGGLLWAGAILLVSLIHYESPNYGLNFLEMMSSVYPWFHASHTVVGILVGTIDGLVDGALAGLLFAFLYNTFGGHLGHA